MDFSQLEQLGVRIFKRPMLKSFTTFQIGGPAPFVFLCRTVPQIKAVAQQLRARNTDFQIIGKGSNIIISDKGLDVPVVCFLDPDAQILRVCDDVFVSGAALLDKLALFAAQEGLDGINYASGIPGTVGGAIAGNAGAYGQQIGDAVVAVELLTPEGEIKTVEQKDLGFVYRDSVLKTSKDIILSVQLALKPSDKERLLKERKLFLSSRQEKHPDYKKTPCAGSVFKNIEAGSNAARRQAAGWFLDQAGAKELSVGGAKVFEKHANIVVKSHDGCTARDVHELILRMSGHVKEKFSIELTPEILFLGEF